MINNNFLKIMSVMIAVFLWIMVVLAQIETVSMTVPVRLINAPKGYVAVSSVQNVSVTVKGSAKLLKNMNYSSVRLDINVADFTPGDSPRRILPSDFKTPLGVEVVEVIPQETIITIDQIATKQVKVVPTFIGDVRKGFKVESVSTHPEVVELEGAKSKLRNISSIATLPINISDMNSGSTYTIGFRLEDGVKQIKPDNVEVLVKMRPDIIKKDVSGVPVSCMDLKSGLTMKTIPKLAKIVISGRSDMLDSFMDNAVFVVNCADIEKPGKYSRAVAYKSDMDGIEVLDISPRKINFEIADEKVFRN